MSLACFSYFRALDTWFILNKINKLKTNKISDSPNLGLVLGKGGRAEVERRVVSVSLENPPFKCSILYQKKPGREGAPSTKGFYCCLTIT